MKPVETTRDDLIERVKQALTNLYSALPENIELHDITPLVEHLPEGDDKERVRFTLDVVLRKDWK